MQKVRRKIQRSVNQTHVLDYPETAKGWHKYSNNPIIPGSDGNSYFDPFVRKIDDTYYMIVSRRRDHTLVRLESKDGIVWQNELVILESDSESIWETRVNRGCFIVKDGTWFLWYTGQNRSCSCIGMAISTNGVNFERVSSNPVLSSEKAYEGNAVMNPCVLWDEQDQIYRMWYAAGENYEPDVIAYAESKDGVSWERKFSPTLVANKSKKYQFYKVGACDVVAYEGGYIMAYIAYQNLDVTRICIATSKDGLLWKEDSNNPLVGPGGQGWDGHAVYKPSICFDRGRIIIWYNGRCGTIEQIGIAYFDKEEVRDDTV